MKAQSAIANLISNLSKKCKQLQAERKLLRAERKLLREIVGITSSYLDLKAHGHTPNWSVLRDKIEKYGDEYSDPGDSD
jgi:hypothetical protein